MLTCRLHIGIAPLLPAGMEGIDGGIIEDTKRGRRDIAELVDNLRRSPQCRLRSEDRIGCPEHDRRGHCALRGPHSCPPRALSSSRSRVTTSPAASNSRRITVTGSCPGELL